MTIRTAVFGASFAKAAYLPALRTIPDVQLVAIASNRLESAQATAAEFQIAHAYNDWRQVLDQHPVDLVCIATPTIHHAPMVLAALEAGAHVICEKPMAMNTAESAQMLERATAKGRVHLIGHELRFNPNRRKIARLIAEGALGQIQHVNILNISNTWGDPASRPAGDWWSDAAMGGGRLGANGSHQLDLLRFWLGEIGAISGQLATRVPNRVDKATGAPWIATADDQVSFTAEMTSGALASVFLSGVARHGTGNQTQIFGSEGSIRLLDADEKLMFAQAGADFQDISEVDPNSTLPGIGRGIWNVSFVGLIREATTAIRTGQPPTAGATFYDGHQCQRAMDAIRDSWAARRWVTLN
jgi:predicted dehydrogenase